MSTPSPTPQADEKKDVAMPIGQHEGDGTNAVTHKPDPGAEPESDGQRRYQPRTGYNHGND